MALNKYAQRYITGLCYAPKEDKFYWNGIIKAPGYMTEVLAVQDRYAQSDIYPDI